MLTKISAKVAAPLCTLNVLFGCDFRKQVPQVASVSAVHQIATAKEDPPGWRSTITGQGDQHRFAWPPLTPSRFWGYLDFGVDPVVVCDAEGHEEIYRQLHVSSTSGRTDWFTFLIPASLPSDARQPSPDGTVRSQQLIPIESPRGLVVVEGFLHIWKGDAILQHLKVYDRNEVRNFELLD